MLSINVYNDISLAITDKWHDNQAEMYSKNKFRHHSMAKDVILANQERIMELYPVIN